MRAFVGGRFSNVLVPAGVLCFFLAFSAHGQVAVDTSNRTLDDAVVQPAVDGIFAAFETHALVGLDDEHGLAQEMEFYEALIGDPRFAREVGNVVVEFGGAARQDIIDRYTNGEIVPYRELRRVWTDTVGWSPTVQHLGYAHFFAQVRETNRTLSDDERIRVWLGEPPVDWSKIDTFEDWFGIALSRDTHAAMVIAENVLDPGEKALVIYGGQHFHPVTSEEVALRAEWAEADPVPASFVGLTLQGLVETEHPDSFFIVQVYDGFDDETCETQFEEGISDWPIPALATPVRGTTLEQELRECRPEWDGILSFPPTMPSRLQEIIGTHYDQVLIEGDALLYLGPQSNLMNSPMLPDLYLDEEYRQEVSRQVQIKTGQPLPHEWGRNVPVTPRQYIK